MLEITEETLVRDYDALLRYAQHAGSHIVAEGVETEHELETLMRLGVPFAQGYLLSRPAPPWPPLALALTARAGDGPAARAARRGSGREVGEIGPSAAAEQAHARFTADAALEALVVLDEQRSVLGLVTRHRLLAKLGHRFGFALYGQRPVIAVADRQCLAIGELTPWAELASRAMARPSETRHTPILLVDGRGRYVRHLTIRGLLAAVQDAEATPAVTPLPRRASPASSRRRAR